MIMNLPDEPYLSARGAAGNLRICGRLCDTGDVVTVLVTGGKIDRVVPGSCSADAGGPDVWVSPGFCDIQVNGYGGIDFNIGAWGGTDEVAHEIAPLYAMLWRSGTALACPTITSNSLDAMRQAFADLAAACAAEPLIRASTPGFHMEGPYIASEDGPRGAHPAEHVRDPDWDEFQRLQEAAAGQICLCTLAPERPGALRFIDKLVTSGVAAAIGHTGADPSTIRDAVQAGATLSTHLGNGAHSQLPRHPNYIWEQLADDRLYASVIADGRHLPDAVLRCFARVKGSDRLILVSDAVSLGGLPAGRYAEGRYEVLPSGKVVLAGTPYLAGAGHLLDVCVANALRWSGLSLAETVSTVSATPARLLRRDADKGRLGPGCDADFTLFRIRPTGPLEIVATVVAGTPVYRA